MNKIITIGREFGSGGREVARKLAEALGIEYYDKEIVEEISKKTEHKFNIKNTKIKRHACLTTFKGLDELSTYLSDKTNGELKPSDYDYYVYDEVENLNYIH